MGTRFAVRFRTGREPVERYIESAALHGPAPPAAAPSVRTRELCDDVDRHGGGQGLSGAPVISYAQNQEDRDAGARIARAPTASTSTWRPRPRDRLRSAESTTGLRSVTLEPTVRQCERFVLRRPLDVDLAVALGRREGRLRFPPISRRTDYRPATSSPRGACRRAQLCEPRLRCSGDDAGGGLCRACRPTRSTSSRSTSKVRRPKSMAGADSAAHQQRIVVVGATRPARQGRHRTAEWEPYLIAAGYLFRVVRWREPVLVSGAEDAPLARHFNAPPNAFDGFQIAEVARLRAEIDRLRHSTVTRTIHDLRVWSAPGRCQAQGAMTAESRKLYLECTTTYQYDHGTGIPRVVRNVIRHLRPLAKARGFDVVPVHFAGGALHPAVLTPAGDLAAPPKPFREAHSGPGAMPSDGSRAGCLQVGCAIGLSRPARNANSRARCGAWSRSGAPRSRPANRNQPPAGSSHGGVTCWCWSTFRSGST